MGDKVERFVSCVVLCRGDAAQLEPFVRKLSTILLGFAADHEIVLVNDASDPEMRGALERIIDQLPYIRLLQLTQRKGDHVAATAGLGSALGDYVCVLDSDNDPPELVPEAVRTAMQGADVVFGADGNQSGRRAFSRLLERSFTRYAKRYLKVDVASGMGSFRCLNRYAVNALTRLAQPHRYYRIWGDYVGLRTVRMFYRGRGRRKGKTLLASIDEALDISVSTSPHPLRVLSALALLFALANVVYIVYVLAIFLVKPDVATGWTTLSLQISGVSLIVIVLLAAMGEYLGRLLERASPNPAFWVLEERTSKRFAAEARVNVVERSAGESDAASHH